MKPLLLLPLAAVALFAQQPPAQHTNLKVGDEAPDFTLRDQNNKESNSRTSGKRKTVILAFFPAAFTGG